MGPRKVKGARRCGRKELVPFLFAWSPVHLIGCHFPQGGGQLVLAVCLCKNKVALLTSCCSCSVLAPGSCPGLWASSWAAYETFFSGDRGHVALHSSTSRWCFSVFQPAACSPTKRSQGEAREKVLGWTWGWVMGAETQAGAAFHTAWALLLRLSMAENKAKISLV